MSLNNKEVTATEVKNITNSKTKQSKTTTNGMSIYPEPNRKIFSCAHQNKGNNASLKIHYHVNNLKTFTEKIKSTEVNLTKFVLDIPEAICILRRE